MEVFRKNESKCKNDEDRKQERKKQLVELERFRSHCNMQQELLYALINKSLFALLIEQQNILSSIGFPSFSLSFIDKLLNHISQLKGKSMGSSSSSKVSFELDGMIISQLSLQRTLVCALLSIRLRFTIPPITQHNQHNQQHLHLNTNNNDNNINPIIINNNNNNNNINNNNNNISNNINHEVRYDDNAMKIEEHEMMHTYNAELRKKRKRRRPLNSHSNNNNNNHSGGGSSNISSDGLSHYQRQPSSSSLQISPYIPLEQQQQHQRYQLSSLQQSTYQQSSSSSISTLTGTPLISLPLSATYFNHLQ